MRKRILPASVAILASLLVALPFTYTGVFGAPVYDQSVGSYNPTPTTGCTPNVVPVGQANPPGSQLEPLAPIWCFTMNPPNPPDAVSGANDWSDNFSGVAPYGRFQDGDYNYRIFPLKQCQQGFKQQYFTNNQHWMQDTMSGGQSNCSTVMRPNRSFHFENGMLVVEQDVAAGISGYNAPGDEEFPEIDVTMAPQPSGNVVDSLYGYGQFGGYWTVGCRLHGGHTFICSVEDAASDVTGSGNNTNCNLAPPARILEISSFEVCGTTHFGGDTASAGVYSRQCDSAAQEPDMMCRDRFRMEITANGMSVYVNGHLSFQEIGWPAGHQIDPNAIASGQWYVYDVNWEALGTQPAYRWHWDNFTVNPHNPDGTFRAPTAAPNFCLNAPMQVCPDTSPTSTPTPAAQATATATPTALSVSQVLTGGESDQVTCNGSSISVVTASANSDVLQCNP